MRYDLTLHRADPAAHYAVYTPDGKVVVAETRTADQAWAVARIERSGEAWVVIGVYNASDAELARAGDGEVATAEQIDAREARWLAAGAPDGTP